MRLSTATCCLLAALSDASPAASPRVLHDGFEAPCEVDSDHDGLANCTELAMLTDRFDPDTDGDGLSDGDEVFATAQGLDLAALGASPRRKDVLLEIDWVDDDSGCGLHSHPPTAAVVEEVRAIFAAIPLPNPDGSNGVNLIVDYGQGFPFTGGTRVPSTAGTVSLETLRASYRPVHLAANRDGYFRYSIHAHSLGDAHNSGGMGDLDESVVTLGCNSPAGYVRNVVVHELGHNFGLMHGGTESCKQKPNYNSVMNYNHIYAGLDINCDRFGDGIDLVGFSDGSRRSLLKTALVEAAGVCADNHPLGQPIDWNLNGLIDPQPVAVDLACPGQLVVADANDLAAIRWAPFRAPGGAAPPPPLEAEPCPPPPIP